MNCKEFSKYLLYRLWEFEADLPAEAQKHYQSCPHCQGQVKKLKSAFELQRQMVSESVSQEDESLGRIWTNIQERLKSDELGEELGIDCQLVRPYLGQVADPLEMAVPPAWLEEHIEGCENCRRKLEVLELLNQVITVAEMPILAEEVIAAEAPSEFMEKVHELRAIRPDDITCRQAEQHYQDMASCNLEEPAPAEIYRHVRNCPSCKEHIRQLRGELGVGIPRRAPTETENVLAKKHGAAGSWAIGVGVFLRNNWAKAAVAGAVLLMVGLLILPAGKAMAVTFEQVCTAFARSQIIRIRHYWLPTKQTQDTGPGKPLEETWYIRKPLVQITIRKDGTYSRFSEAEGVFVRYSPEGKLLFSKQYSPEKLQELTERLRQDLDFRRNLGLSKPTKTSWRLVEEGVQVEEKFTNVYELVALIGKPEDEEYDRFRVYVDESTGLPMQMEKYHPHWKTREWELLSTIRYAYPERIPEEILNPTFANR